MLHPNPFIKHTHIHSTDICTIHNGVNLTAFEFDSQRNIAVALLFSTAIYCSTSGINRAATIETQHRWHCLDHLFCFIVFSHCCPHYINASSVCKENIIKYEEKQSHHFWWGSQC